MKARAKPVVPALSLSEGQRMPKGEREQKFCEHWLEHFDPIRAYKQAGYAVNSSMNRRSLELYRKFSHYLEKLRAVKGKELAKRLAIRETDILEEIAALGFANVQDYVEVYTENGKELLRRKPIMQLTRGQASAVTQVEFHPDGTVTYLLPEPKDKRPALELIGKNFGMFDQKLIAEHRHMSKQRAESIGGLVSPDKLAMFEKLLIEAIGDRAAQSFIGYTREVEEEPGDTA